MPSNDSKNITIPRFERWEFANDLSLESRSTDNIVSVLLKNRGIVGKEAINDFVKPPHPYDLSLAELKISLLEVKKAIKRIKLAQENNEKVVIYGDYDADGVAATAIMWETLFGVGVKVTPYIPERFSEGYGLNSETIKSLKSRDPNLKLIITVDNGIVAHEAVKTANKLGIEVIIVDHHEKAKTLPKASSIVHTTKICGSALSWILAREILKGLEIGNTSSSSPGKLVIENSLELAGIGTIADQMPLTGANRSFAKHGLRQLNKTERPGLLALFQKSDIVKGFIDTYNINFMIAPRLNAMGRMENAMESLRLLCTKDKKRASLLAELLDSTNIERQKVVDDIILHAKEHAILEKGKGVIILAHESYHEGVIGLVASKMVEEFHRPAIIFSKGKKYSKASARSIAGFNIIEAIRALDDLLESGGGHAMAAGFTIATKSLENFKQKMNDLSTSALTEEILSRKLKIDVRVGFDNLTQELYDKIKDFAPNGIGNPTPLFVTNGVGVVESRAVGREYSHLKLALGQNKKFYDAIAFGFGSLSRKLSKGDKIDIAYALEENTWNGQISLQLKIKDMRMNEGN